MEGPQPLGPLPVRRQFALVEPGPLDREPPDARREVAADEGDRVDANDGSCSPYVAWRCGGAWSEWNIRMVIP